MNDYAKVKKVNLGCKPDMYAYVPEKKHIRWGLLTGMLIIALAIWDIITSTDLIIDISAICLGIGWIYYDYRKTGE